MTYPKLLKLCALASLLLVSAVGYSQCPVKFKTSHSSDKGKGIIELEVKSSDSFVIELLSLKGIEKKVVQTKNGSGDGKFTFNDLATGNGYQISISFPSKKEFLCKKKYSEEIFFEIN